MFAPLRVVTPVGKTAHFEVSYLTMLGKKGATLARAIVENCEGEYAVLKRFFGGLTLRNASDRSRFFRLADL
jgi:hypothetical protein